MTRSTKSCCSLLALAFASPAMAAVVIDPLPPIAAGATVDIRRFATLPPSAEAGSRALVQQLQPLRDGSDRLVANDTRGLLYTLDRTSGSVTPWFDIRTQDVGFSNASNPTQTGLMSFAFHPNFGIDPDRPGYATFYTMDTSAPTGRASWGVPGAGVDHENVVHEWTVADPTAATATIVASREVMRVAQPFSDHGPCTIAFDPAAKAGGADYGKLYIGFGDGGAANDPLDSAQNLSRPFGKILRIDPVDPDGAGPLGYSIPADNPFVATEGARGEVWAYGLRNPQQFSFDAATGRMLIADIGQNQIEEVDLGVAGANYGWPAREGTFARGIEKGDFNIYDLPANDGSFADPLAQYDHEEIFRDGHRGAGVGGAFLYTGTAIPELFGKIVLDDLVSGRLFYFSFQDALDGRAAPLSELFVALNGVATTMLALAGTSNDANGRVDLRLGQDASGELYLLTKRDGAIFQLAGAVPEPATWLTLSVGMALVAGTLRTGRRRRARPIASASR